MSRISTAELGSYYLKFLLLWALVENQSKGAFAANIIKARVDANKNGIQAGLEHYANEYGLTVEEMSNIVVQLDSEGRSIPQIHAALKEAGASRLKSEEETE